MTLGTVTLAEVDVGPITSIAVFPGGAKAVAKGLKVLGLAMPEPNGFAEKKGARIVWMGRDQAFLTGVAALALEGAAVTDQSDGWTVLAVTGMQLARTPARALASWLWNRSKLRLRGLAFRERDVTQVSARELTQIDTCWSAAVGLGMVDNIRGADYQTRSLLLALRAGEPYRVCRAMALEAVSYTHLTLPTKRIV